MLLRTKLIMIFFFFIMGCAHNGPLIGSNEPVKTVSVGMTKSELIEIKGEPDRVAASGGLEYLLYKEQAHIFDPAKSHYYMFKNGKLWEYGRDGEFNTPINVKISH